MCYYFWEVCFQTRLGFYTKNKTNSTKDIILTKPKPTLFWFPNKNLCHVFFFFTTTLRICVFILGSLLPKKVRILHKTKHNKGYSHKIKPSFLVSKQEPLLHCFFLVLIMWIWMDLCLEGKQYWVTLCR